MNKFQEWAKREYSLRQRIFAFLLEGIFFLLIYPSLLVVTSSEIDHWLRIPHFKAGAVNPIVGLLLIAGGALLALWTIQTQITIGSGTPVPIMPTQRLIIRGPYTFCRNPMVLGTIIASVGICVWIGSFSAIVIVMVLSAILISYIKLVEEKELAVRFGTEYIEYKRNTPFILPRLLD